jgi:hypothetical protein
MQASDKLPGWLQLIVVAAVASKFNLQESIFDRAGT